MFIQNDYLKNKITNIFLLNAIILLNIYCNKKDKGRYCLYIYFKAFQSFFFTKILNKAKKIY